MLRPYQTQLVTDIDAAWSAGSRNVLAVLPTGGGKTVVFTYVMSRESGICVALAHRQELVSQMSLALARNGLRHRVIAPPQVRGEIEALHMLEFGRRFVDPHSNVICAGVHTIVNHPEPWMQQCALWVCDEGHHLVDGNIWHKAVTMLPNARGLSVTAIPQRADGKGLGRHADGVIDVMIVGPSMRELIEQGYLTEYRIFCPPSDLDLSHVAIGASGDFVNAQLREAVHKSRVVGDIVDTYVKHTMGKLGITFTVDVEDAEKTADAYRKAGVNAEALSAKTPGAWRNKVMRAFRNRELLQIVNCDLLGEGTDVPAVEVVSMGRPTESFQIFGQQFGRMMRPLEGKSHGILFDHVGNVKRHGLPDAFRTWSLDARERSGRNTPRDVIPVTSCFQCSAAYERVYAACPYCGFRNEPLSRSGVQHVDGDLAELDEAALDALRGGIQRVDKHFFPPQGLPPEAEIAARRNHVTRQNTQAVLRRALALYGGWRKAAGDSHSMMQRRFYLTFGVDVMTAQSLGRADADTLRDKIEKSVPGFPADY